MIGSALGRISTAERMSVDQLKEALQNKTLPAYIAVPLIEEKLNMNSRMQNMAAMQQAQQPRPPIADAVMQRAAMESGINALPSNLPVARGAGGGIVAFAEGGDADDEDDDEDLYGDTKMDKENEALLMRLLASRRAAPGMGAGQGLTMPAAPAANMGIDALGSGLRADSLIGETSAATPSTGLKLSSGHKYAKDIVAQAEKLGVDPRFALYIAGKETGGLKNPETAKSSAGALGIMQLMPGTAKEMGVKDPFDPNQNIEGGLRYAKMMLDKYQDPRLAAIAYNWGPGNTDKWLKAGADMTKLPKETRNYVASLKEGGAIRFQNQGLAIDPNVQKEIEELGAQLDAARLAVGRPPSSRELSLDPSLSDKYKANVERRNQLQKQYESLMETKGGLGGRADLQLSPTGRKVVPVPNPVTQQMVKSAPPTAAQAAAMPLSQAATPESRAMQAQYEAQDIQEGDLGRLQTPASGAMAMQGVPEEKPAAPSFADKLEELLSKREKSIGEQRQQDKYMALLAAGLGMMGGKSRYAAENIGQGALQGVASMQAANRQRAAEENALLSGRLGQYRIGQGEALRTQLAGEAQQTRLTQQLSAAKNRMMSEIIKAKKMDPLTSMQDPNIAATVAAQADALLAKDPGYQAIYKKIYGTDFTPETISRGTVDYFKNYGLTPGKK